MVAVPRPCPGSQGAWPCGGRQGAWPCRGCQGRGPAVGVRGRGPAWASGGVALPWASGGVAPPWASEGVRGRGPAPSFLEHSRHSSRTKGRFQCASPCGLRSTQAWRPPQARGFILTALTSPGKGVAAYQNLTSLFP